MFAPWWALLNSPVVADLVVWLLLRLHVRTLRSPLFAKVAALADREQVSACLRALYMFPDWCGQLALERAWAGAGRLPLRGAGNQFLVFRKKRCFGIHWGCLLCLPCMVLRGA